MVQHCCSQSQIVDHDVACCTQKLRDDMETIQKVSQRISAKLPATEQSTELNPAFTRRMVAQMLVQIKAYQAVITDQGIPKELADSLNSFYDEERPARWRTHVPGMTLRDPASALLDAMSVRHVPTPIRTQDLRVERSAVFQQDFENIRTQLGAVMSMFAQNRNVKQSDGSGKAQPQTAPFKYMDGMMCGLTVLNTCVDHDCSYWISTIRCRESRVKGLHILSWGSLFVFDSSRS